MTKKEITTKYKKRNDLNNLMLEVTGNGLKYHKISSNIYNDYITECEENGYAEEWAIMNWDKNVIKG